MLLFAAAGMSVSAAVELAEAEGLNSGDLKAAMAEDQRPVVHAALAAQAALCRCEALHASINQFIYRLCPHQHIVTCVF